MGLEIGNPHGVQVVNGTNRSGAKDDDDLDTMATIDARLAAIDGGYYTAKRLETMTYNDKVYAIRVIDTAAEVK